MSDTERDTNVLREVLYKYAGMGAHLFPLCWPEWDDSGRVHCGYGHLDDKGEPEQDNIGKAPLLNGGYHNATQTRAGIDDWMRKYPKANWGAHWPNQLALDVDQDNGAYEDLARLVADIGELPQTLEQLSGGGGKHIVYLLPGGVNLKAAKLPGYDRIHVKINGYIVIAGSIHRSGNRYSILHDGAIAQVPQALINLFIKKQTTLEINRIDAIKDGSRHIDLISLIGKLRNDKISEDLIETMAQSANASANVPLSQVEVTKMVREYEHQAKSESYNLTDLGNAERLVFQFGETIRYCYERKLWLIWQGTHWQWDYNGEIMRLAQKTARSIFNEAANEDSKDRRESLAKWASQSENNMRLSAMITQAQSMVPIKVDQLDCDEWLLNCDNGTIDLKTGELQPYNPNDYITRKIETNYDPSASSEVWFGFLSRIFEDKTELIDFIQRALGYSITGNQGEQAIFFCHGGGWNGKSTLLGAIRKVLGEYASEVEPAAFMVDKHKGTGPNEAIASLYKVNFCSSTEIEDGQKLSTSLLKRMTGGESLRCERKFEHGFNFKPQYKLWLCGNHEPEISDTTNSIWNRIKKIPFNVKINASERIKDYDQILANEHGQAILAWLIQGCLDWQRQGLGESPEVREATQEYRDSQDVLHDFLTENCLIKGSETEQVAALYKAYTDWSESNSDKYFLGKNKFNSRILEKGFVKLRGTANKTVWRGLRLLTIDEKLN